MVDQAKQRALIQECQAVCKQLRKMITAQKRKLLEARRTKRDFDAAKKEFEDARANLYALINTWNLSKTTQEQIYKDKLDRVIKALSQKAESFIPLAIENTLNDWSLGSVKQEKDVESSRAPETTKATMQHSTTVLILESAAHAEEFLCLSQTELTKSLNELRRDFVISVRKMAEEARAKHFQDLKDKIKYLDPKMQPEFRKEIIEDLNDQSVNIRQVAFKQIRNKIKIIKTWGRNKQTIYLAMDVIEGHYREEIVKPWIKDLARESEKSLIGTITASSQVARTAVENALAREDARYKRESEERIPNKYGVVQNMVALNSSLWAAESALQTIWKELLESLNVMGKAPLNTTESIVEETLDTMHTGTESVLIQGESREGERTVMPFPQAEQMEGRSSEASILRGKNSEVLGSGSESPGSALEGIKTSVQQYTHAATQTLAEGSDKESDSSSSDPSSTYGRVNGVDVPLKYAHAAIQTQVEAVLEESYPFHPGHLATVKEDPDPLIPMLQDLLHQRRPVELYNVTNISNHPFAYGGYAQIYAGEFQGRQVAVKCITPRRNRTRPAPWEQSMSRRVDREIEVWSALSHPNILDCLGYYCNTKLADFPCIVSPLCVHGSLDIYLRESPNITDAERLRLVSQTSLGIAYLHDLGIIHGDLKPLNILVDEHYQVRLCDFGLVRALEGLEPTPTPYIATPLYMAPELSDYRVSTFAGDIWAFGCIALEVIEGLQPYARRQNEMRTYGRAYRNQYPADKSMSRWPQSDFKEAAWALMKSCWNQFPFLRPPIKSMVCQLQMMEEMLPLEE
ncbi:hypothetical protein PIIN_10063 [Serendipita indica DSM 11827]|uniref:Protein kinase domain-containing protein n=1 Tax=Serendipita indica (strain DSM 11827) TaxID=1109443 RepID=G4TXM0_SERID|nr:hypothetical protein PIIN_10063 [Serendipita indica DSM 11827]